MSLETVIGDATLYLGDCLAWMATLPESSVDSIVTDPPYELTSAHPGGRSLATQGAVMTGFMGMKWDGTGIAQRVELWAECLRVLKPGGHLLAFSGSRTYHRMTCAIEDAGFEVRDQIMWLYGSGFPKSRNGEWGGTALKPAHEPICVARKPLIGTVEENWQAYGTGALNIDDCRIPTDDVLQAGAGTSWDAIHRGEGRSGEASANRRYAESGSTDYSMLPGVRGGDAKGRWPANVIHDGSDEVVAAFPFAPGQQGALRNSDRGEGNQVALGKFSREMESTPRGDKGSAARFFYCAKASRAERNEGCGGLADQKAGMLSNTSGQHITRRDAGYSPEPVKNNHPTVKPTDLMAYLCRLVTPAGGVVLDPFLGSGSTGKAAIREGFRFIGIDITPEYIEIAKARIAYEVEQVRLAKRQIDMFSEVAA